MRWPVEIPLVLAALLVAPPPAAALQIQAVGAHRERVAVTWDDGPSGTGRAALRQAQSPWHEVAPALVVGPDPFVRSGAGLLGIVSRGARTLTVADPSDFTPAAVWPLGPGSRIEDVALVDDTRAYLSLAEATHLLRLDLSSGALVPVLDFTPFADGDGVPDLGTMAVDGGRLFVQVRRLDTTGGGNLPLPPLVAVVDLASETFVDTDPSTPGVQAIALAGTPPKLKMQVLPRARRLFLSASGAFFDEGGIESVDLDGLVSLGLVLREADGRTGADLGAFTMVSPAAGYLTFSTDFALSSHLFPFVANGGVGPGGELHVSVGYLAPALVHAPAAGLLFVPQGAFGQNGLVVFEAASGRRLTATPLPTGGPPTDLELVRLPHLPAVPQPQ